MRWLIFLNQQKGLKDIHSGDHLKKTDMVDNNKRRKSQVIQQLNNEQRGPTVVVIEHDILCVIESLIRITIWKERPLKKVNTTIRANAITEYLNRFGFRWGCIPDRT